MLIVKYLIWAALAGFAGYTAYCMVNEKFFKSVKQITSLHWGRQIGADLYFGLMLMLFVIYLHEGSWLSVLLWGVAAVIFGNLATLTYFALHFDAIVARFMP